MFKILNKIEAGPRPLESVRNDVIRDALVEKRLRTIDNFLIKLSERCELEINSAVIDTMQVNDINMLILKQHYASRTAAPLITPLHMSHRWQNYMDKIYPEKR